MDNAKLIDIRSLHTEIDILGDEILKWRSIAEYTSSQIRLLPRERQSDPMGEAIAQLDELCQMLSARLSDYYRQREKLEWEIADMPSMFRILIRLRYIEGKSWTQISRKVNYHEKHCRRLTNEAIKTLQNR